MSQIVRQKLTEKEKYWIAAFKFKVTRKMTFLRLVTLSLLLLCAGECDCCDSKRIGSVSQIAGWFTSCYRMFLLADCNTVW